MPEYYFQMKVLSIASGISARCNALPSGSMAARKGPEKLSEFGKRFLLACDLEGRSPTSAERDAGLNRGYLSPIIHGKRGKQSMNLEHMAAVAKILHVNFEWLVMGTGPMRREGRSTTPAEQAITFARSAGAREAAIQIAWERNRDREADLDVWAWARAIDEEDRRLSAAGVPRPVDDSPVMRDDLGNDSTTDGNVDVGDVATKSGVARPSKRPSNRM